MSTHIINRSFPMRISMNDKGTSSGTSTAKMITNSRVVLTKPSPKRSHSGESLADMIEKRGRFDDRRVISICISILNALVKRVAEGHRMIPENLNPSSIIFKENGEIEFIETDPEITLISKSEKDGSELTISGTPAYMSPENLTGINEGSRFGIYTVGAIMYEMLTGRPPYNGESAHNTLNAVKKGPPTRLVQLTPRTNLKLIGICERCMTRWANCRYSNMFDLLSDLERLQAASFKKSTSRIKSWVCSML